MNSYELYNRVLSAINEDEGTFNAAARNWIESGAEPNFENEDAKNLFYTAKMACTAWRNKAINGRVSKLRMIECVRKIAEMNLENPYDPNEKIEEPENTQAKEPEVNKKEVHVLGVVPEEKNVVTEEPKEEPKEEKHLFGKRKNR